MADYSVFAGKPPKDPVEQLSGLISTAHNAQELGGRMAVGDIIGKHTNADGTVDIPNIIKDYGNNPQARYQGASGLSDIISAGVAQQGAQEAQVKYVGSQLSALASKPNLKPSDVSRILPLIAKVTQIPADQLVSRFLSNWPKDPKEQKRLLIGLGNMVDPLSAMEGEEGPPGPGGEKRQISKGQARFERAGVGEGQDEGEAPAPAPGTKPARNAGMQVSNPLGSDKSSTEYQSALTSTGSYNQAVAPLEQAREAFSKLPEGATGEGSEARQTFKTFMHSLSPEVTKALGIDVEKMKDYDKLRKYLVQAAQNRASSMGHQSDMTLGTSISGSPNIKITDMAARDLVNYNLALFRMEQAQKMAAIKAGPVGYTKAFSDLGGKLDPRAFALDMMAPKERAKLRNLKGAERAKFVHSMQLAYDAGSIQKPGE